MPSTDVNNDQVTEVPLAILMPLSSSTSNSVNSSTSSDAAYMLDWYAFSTGDAPVRVCTTYQNVSENWQFMISDAWRKSVTVVKSTDENETKTTFLDYSSQNNPVELLTIHRLTGDMRSYYASQESMFELARTATEIYTVSIPENAVNSQLKLDYDQIKERFSIISQSWSN